MDKENIVFAFLLVLCSVLLVYTLVGCSSTYPKEHVHKSLVELCRREYGVDVEVEIIGKTIGVYIPINELIDKELKISPTALAKVDDVIMSVSRVALSTDAEFNFFVLVAQDPMLPQLELVIIRYVEDVKRFLVMDISRYEYIDRMITEVKLTPQAQKEKLLRELFKKLGLDISDKAVEAYFKSGYIDTIADIGYWNNRFFLKDITMGEFLVRQVEERIRKGYLKSDILKEYQLDLVKANYKDGVFNFEIESTPKEQIPVDNNAAVKEIYSIISKVIQGYKFEDFEFIRLSYERDKIVFAKEDLEEVKKRTLRLEDII